MSDHIIKHRGIAVGRHRLEGFSQVAVIAVQANRNPTANRSLQFPWMAFPLLERVWLKEHPVKIPAYLAQDDLLGILRMLDRFAMGFQVIAPLEFRCWTPQPLLKSIEIDRKTPVAVLGEAFDLIRNLMPLGELGEILDDAGRVAAKIMRTIRVDQHAGFIVAIISIASNMLALVHHHARKTCLRESLRRDESGKTGPYDKKINIKRFAHDSQRISAFQHATALGRKLQRATKPAGEFGKSGVQSMTIHGGKLFPRQN